MNGNVQVPTENEQNSPSALYLDSVKGVLLLWHEEIMGGGGDIQNLNSVLIRSAQEIASCLASEQSRQELQYVHELVMKAIETDSLAPPLQPLSQKHEEQLRLLSKHFDKRYEHIINTDLTDSSLPLTHHNGSLLDYSGNWNGNALNHTQSLDYTQGDLKYTQEQFEEKLSEYTQKLTLNLENKYIQELEEMNKKHEATIRQIEKFYENKIADEKVNSSFSKIEYDDEMAAVIQDRDNLRQMTQSLRQVVTDLSNYVNNCETQLNQTLLNELLEDTSGIDDCASFQQLKHVHFAPDISTLVSSERLDYSDLRATLDSCLERLKREASQLLSVTQARPKHARNEDELATRHEAEIERLKLDAVSFQKQIEAADAQLKSSRQFLEEQTVERETEREELLTQISQLKAQIREQKHVGAEDHDTKLLEDRVEALQDQVKKLTEEKQTSDDNMDEAKAKIWELREIVASLEKDLAQARENEAGLARKLAEFETLFERQYQSHQQLALEFETLKMTSRAQGIEAETSTDPAGLHQIKTQILWLERSLQRRTKELETLYVFDANLSSPSEDISARDEMVNTPDSGRVDSPGLPLEQVASLYDQFVRHSRAEDATVKCLKDTVLQLTAVREQLAEVQHERDALQARYNKTLGELSQAKVQLEELRHSLFSRNNQRVDEKSAEMDLLEDKVKTLAKALLIKEDEIKEKERELSKALLIKDDEIREKERAIEAKDRMMWSLEQEISGRDVTDYRHRDASHVSHSDLKLKRPVVRFNDTLNETPGFSFDKNETGQDNFLHENIMLKDDFLKKENLVDLNRILKEELAEKEKIIVEIKADADSLKKVLDGLQETVKEARRHSENMSEQQAMVEVCKCENEKLREKSELYEKEIGKLKEDLENVKKELESACKNKDEYEEEIRRSNEDMELLKQEVEDLKKKLKSASSKKDEHKKDLEQLNIKISEIQIECSRCEAENTQLKKQIESCEKDLVEFLEEFPVLNENKRDWTKKHGIVNIVETLRDELTLYIDKQEIYRREKGHVNEKERDYMKEIVDLKSRETQLKKKLQTVEEKLSKCENEIDSLKQNEILLNNQLERVNMTCEVYKSKALDLDKKEDLIKKLKENIEMSEENYVKLENEISELRNKEKEMADEIYSKEKAIEALKISQNNEDCEQCKEYIRDQTSRFSNPFPADQSATTSFDIRSLKDEMFSELAEKLRKELTLSAKLDEQLLIKQKDFTYEQQDQIIQTLNEDKRKLRELILAERARFESEQLQDADLLEKLRQKLESTKENARKIIKDLEDEIQYVLQEENKHLSKIKVLEASLQTYKNNLEKSSRSLKELEVQFSDQKTLLEVTQAQIKQKTNDLNSAKEKIASIENDLSKTKEKLTAIQKEKTTSDVQNVIKDQTKTLTMQSQKIEELEKLLADQKREHEDITASKNQLEERIRNLNETLMMETKRVLKLEAEIEIRKRETGEHSDTTRTLRDKLREKELSLEVEKERVATLREKLLEKSETLSVQMEKAKRLEERVRSLHEEKDALISSRHSEVEHGKQMRQILARLMRAESCNKSLVFQKRYLKNMISSYVRMECRTVQMLEGKPHAPARPKRTFRVLVLTVISLFRMKYLRRKRSTTMLRTLK